MKKNNCIRIATRKSKLALWQANFIKQEIEKKYPELTVTLFEMTTEGDQQQNSSLSEIGGKSVFVKTLQNALLHHEADIAVHCVKDMSVYETDGLVLAAIGEREDPRDAFISTQFSDLNALPKQAVVGTSSPRRASLIKSFRPDLQIKLLRGNVDTRLTKLDNGEYDAIILAAAGLHRLGLSNRITAYLSDDNMTPAIGQGALGIECRESDTASLEMVQFLHHIETAHCIIAERTVNKILGGDCQAAIGAHAKIINDELHLSAVVCSLDGKIVLRAQSHNAFLDAERLGKMVADDLIAQGAKELIRHA